MSAPDYYRGGGFAVGERLLRTPRKTYRLDQIEYVSVQRPLLLFVGLPAAGVIGFVAAFHRYLFPGEIAALVFCSITAIVIASLIGAMRVHSLALRDDEVATSFGFIVHLRRVRSAVELAMARHDGREDRP